jgi:hypothetical protein
VWRGNPVVNTICALLFFLIFWVQESARELCYEHQKLPPPPHAPETRGYNAGVKPSWSTGEVRVVRFDISIGFESNVDLCLLRRRIAVCAAAHAVRLQVLYNSNDMEPHVALQIIEKIVRLMQV